VAERRVEIVMGMPVSIELRDHLPRRRLDETFDWLRRVDAMFSTYRAGSEIARLSRGVLAATNAHRCVRDVLIRCEQLRAATGGFFDIRATGRLDPSGFVKGWAIDRAAELLEGAGARRFCINAGGDVLVRGGDIWRIGIQHPRARGRLAGVVALTDGAIATSGAYERGPHIVDPRSRKPPTGLLSVTVIGPRLGIADAYATAAFAMGTDGPEWTASLDGYDAMTILECDRVLSTPGFVARCPGGSLAASIADARPSVAAPVSRGHLPRLAAEPILG
jgi:FAD:protein FMN transferase